MFDERLRRIREELVRNDADVLLVSTGADLPYLTGYEAMPLERLTMLVVPRDGEATLVVPELEAPRVVEYPNVFSVMPWKEGDDPTRIVAQLSGAATAAAIGDQTWAGFLVDLQQAMPNTSFHRASSIVGSVRAKKDPHEVEALRRAGAAVDRIAERLQAGEIPLIGQTEAAVSAELGRQIREEGHHKVNFAIVAAGSNAASPHHEAGSRVIQDGEIVLCDFGGTMLDEYGVGYCSDITRCVFLGEPPQEVAEAYEVLLIAQASGVAAAVLGSTCQDIDRATRRVIDEAGFGEYFIHRTGHGIGVEAHEDPYIIEGNETVLEQGHAFSVEPGIYVSGRFGMRLEDIVVTGPDALNRVDHNLVALS